MAERFRDEERFGGGYRRPEERGEFGSERRGGDFDRERSFGERGYRDFGRGYGRDYGGERGRYGGIAGHRQGYNPRTDYDRGRFGYSPEYGEGPLYGGGFEGERAEHGRPYGYGREYERDYGRTPLAAYGLGGEGYGGFGREDIRAPGGWQDYGRDDTFRERISRGWDRSTGAVGALRDEEPGGRLGFRGRGPKGYTRSDDRIREDVCDRLTDDPAIDASNIEVKVSGGEITLSGTVASREDKRHAEDWAEATSGVKNVQNLLRVEQPLELGRESERGELTQTGAQTQETA
jgi:BON domain-containing protein